MYLRMCDVLSSLFLKIWSFTRPDYSHVYDEEPRIEYITTYKNAFEVLGEKSYFIAALPLALCAYLLCMSAVDIVLIDRWNRRFESIFKISAIIVFLSFLTVLFITFFMTISERTIVY